MLSLMPPPGTVTDSRVGEARRLQKLAPKTNLFVPTIIHVLPY